MIIWLVTSCLILGHVQSQSNATTNPKVPPQIVLSLNCGGEKVDQFPGFAVALGGPSTSKFAVSTPSILPLPQDPLDRPVCGGVTPSGKGYWFHVFKGTEGEVDLLFCTLTDTPLTITPTVYQAARISENEVGNCEDMTCIAHGTRDPLQYEAEIRSAGRLCPSAPNSGGVHFTASKDAVYFVHVDVTTDLTELTGFETISYVVSGSSHHWSPSWWSTTYATSLFLLYGFLKR